MRKQKNTMPTWKRALDLVVLLITVPFWLPIMCIIALLVRFTSSGPILFRQERLGLGGQPFQLFKFRSMTVGAETLSHCVHFSELIVSDKPMEKLDGNDSRVTGLVGRLLRASGFDELPQLFNVLRGEMSLVGPRPCLRYEYEKYRPEDRERLNAVPGLTGLWQVSGKNALPFAEMVRLDVQYIKTQSLGLDLSILLRTPMVIFHQLRDALKKRFLAADSSPKVLGVPSGQNRA